MKHILMFLFVLTIFAFHGAAQDKRPVYGIFYNQQNCQSSNGRFYSYYFVTYIFEVQQYSNGGPSQGAIENDALPALDAMLKREGMNCKYRSPHRYWGQFGGPQDAGPLPYKEATEEIGRWLKGLIDGRYRVYMYKYTYKGEASNPFLIEQ